MTARQWTAVLALLGLGCRGAPEPLRPNIVLVIGDDHGYPYSSFMGNTIVRTPNLDRLARQGTVLPTAYVTASRCRPSLLSLLTGLEPYQLDRRGGSRRDVLRHSETLARLLAEGGYATFQAGKLWGGSYAAAGFEGGTAGEQRAGPPMVVAMGGADSIEIGRSTMKAVHDFIDAQAVRPFFLWFAPLLPHAPHDAPPEYHVPYRNLGLSQGAANYYASVSRLDDVVGELVASLDRAQLRRRTLMVYLSDNGFDQSPQAQHVDESTGGPRGKGSMYELGFRTPIIFNWPGHVAAGVVRDALVSAVDLVPTLLGYAGVPVPDGLAGHDLRPLIEGRVEHGPRELLVGHMQNAAVEGSPFTEAFFVRSPRWHYIWYTELGRDELYAVDTDPDETADVAARNPEIVASFRGKITEWRAALAGPETP